MKCLDLISKFDKSVPYVLTERNLLCFIDARDLFLKCQENDPFFKRVITEYKKLIAYNGVKLNRS